MKMPSAAADDDRQQQAHAGAVERGAAVGDELAALEHVEPGDDDVGERRQRRARDQFEPRRRLPREREQQQRQSSGSARALLHRRALAAP